MNTVGRALVVPSPKFLPKGPPASSRGSGSPVMGKISKRTTEDMFSCCTAQVPLVRHLRVSLYTGKRQYLSCTVRDLSPDGGCMGTCIHLDLTAVWGTAKWAKSMITSRSGRIDGNRTHLRLAQFAGNIGHASSVFRFRSRGGKWRPTRQSQDWRSRPGNRRSLQAGEPGREVPVRNTVHLPAEAQRPRAALAIRAGFL